VVLLDDGLDFDFDLRSARLLAACTCDDAATCALDVLAALLVRDPAEVDDAAVFFF
jgi:hypothetical protein